MAVRTTRMVLSLTIPVITVLLIAIIVKPNKPAPRVKSGLLRFENFQTGDIIFQISQSSQSKAIQTATHSPYSHMGIIYQEDREYFVYEAVQPVKLTPLSEWIKRGEKGHYVVKRLKDTTRLTPEGFARLKHAGQKYRNKDYDSYFEWSDDRVYCSELVWKMYDEAFGIKLGELQQLQAFDLSSDVVKRQLNERYRNNIPLTENVISPASIFGSDKLLTVVIQ